MVVLDFRRACLGWLGGRQCPASSLEMASYGRAREGLYPRKGVVGATISCGYINIYMFIHCTSWFALLVNHGKPSLLTMAMPMLAVNPGSAAAKKRMGNIPVGGNQTNHTNLKGGLNPRLYTGFNMVVLHLATFFHSGLNQWFVVHLAAWIYLQTTNRMCELAGGSSSMIGK